MRTGLMPDLLILPPRCGLPSASAVLQGNWSRGKGAVIPTAGLENGYSAWRYEI